MKPALTFIETELWATRVYITRIGILDLFAPVTWPCPDDLSIQTWPVLPGDTPNVHNMNFLRQGFWKLSSNRQTDRQTDKLSLVTSGHVTKMAVTTFDPPQSKALEIHANLMALSFIEPELWAMKVYIARIGILDVFGSCDLKLDPYCLEIYRMCKYELRTSRLSKVIVWQTYRHTYRQTDRQTESTEIINHDVVNCYRGIRATCPKILKVR